MNIHEHQAKALLGDYGVPVAQGQPIFALSDVARVCAEVAGPPFVLKAQIHAGGRGAGHFAHDPTGGGGVRFCATAADVHKQASAMLGQTLVTRQTGEAGKRVQRLYLEEATQIHKELYLSLLVDRGLGRIIVVACAEGGMDIEELAVTAPEKIIRLVIDPAVGYQPYLGRRLAIGLGLEGNPAQAPTQQVAQLLERLVAAFLAVDASVIEINPLVITKDDRLLALDAKISLDDNALFRHPELAALRDENEEDPRERAASDKGLSYLRLEGSIGCLVNGAGLAMATMDIIKHYGGAPANFLDVGGGATQERVAQAFALLLEDPQVRAVLVNIFGGIMRCDTIAQGIIEAARMVDLRVPLIVRLEGTAVDLGKQALAASGLPITSASDLDEAAQAAVAAALGG